jgi:TonB family protein
MNFARWILFAVFFVVTAACLAQQSTPAAPAQPVSIASAPVRDPHSNSADLAVPLCPAKFNDSLTMNGIADVNDKSVTQPKVIQRVEAEFSDEARRALGSVRKKKNQAVEFEGVSVVSLVVDGRGNPQNLCISKSIGYGLDANTAKVVQQYRFDPATRDGRPVAKRISIQVDFTLY